MLDDKPKPDHFAVATASESERAAIDAKVPTSDDAVNTDEDPIEAMDDDDEDDALSDDLETRLAKALRKGDREDRA